MGEATFTFRVPDELKDAFASAARAQDRSGAQLLRDFMRDFVRRQQEAAAHDVWFRRQVEIGREAADAGDLTPHDEVEAEFAARRAATRRKLNAGS